MAQHLEVTRQKEIGVMHSPQTIDPTEFVLWKTTATRKKLSAVTTWVSQYGHIAAVERGGPQSSRWMLRLGAQFAC